MQREDINIIKCGGEVLDGLPVAPKNAELIRSFGSTVGYGCLDIEDQLLDLQGNPYASQLVKMLELNIYKCV